MQKLINLLLVLLLMGSAATVFAQQDNEKQDQQAPSKQDQQAPPQQDQQASPQGRAASSTAVQSVTGCVVKSDQGYALKTESDSYPIETDQDLSQYVNKQVKVTGILEHHTGTASSSESGNNSVITDIRLRMVATVVGDCNQAPK